MSTYAGPVTTATVGNRVRLDWLAYFKKFVEAHGEPEEVDPVDTEEGITLYSRLLFPDGWRYSNFDYQGPEFPPPDEPALSNLLLLYWRQRRSRLLKEHRELWDHINGMANWADLRDQPLQQRVVYATENEEGKRVMVTEVGDMSLEGLKSKADDLAYAVQECNDHIESL